MRTLIIGAGAVGGIVGGRMQAAGRDVTFLVRARRAEQLRHTGIQVTGARGEFTVQPHLVSAQELRDSRQTFGLVVVGVKSYALDAAIEDFAPAVGPETMILPLLNGMRHLDVLVARFGKERVLGGTTRIVADMNPEGHIRQMEGFNDLVFGPLNGKITPQVQAVAECLHNVGVDEELSSDMLGAMWAKWVLLASLGSITCLLRGSIGEVVAAPNGLETAEALIAECNAIALAAGHPPNAEFYAAARERLTRPGSPLTASMYRDLHKGQPVEADHILGDLLVRGQALGIHAPLLTAAYVQLSIYSRSL